MNTSEFLQPTYFLDFDHPAVAAYALETTANKSTPEEKAVALFYRVRDEFAYWPYDIDIRPPAMKASSVLGKRSSYCAQKAILMAACCRKVGIESRLQFFTVKNHLGIGQLKKYTKSELLVFHTGLQVKLHGEWLKVLPAFDKQLCDKLGVKPLEFDGYHEASQQEFVNDEGVKQGLMEYIHDYGPYADLPAKFMMVELRKAYPHIFDGSTKPEDLKFISKWDDTI